MPNKRVLALVAACIGGSLIAGTPANAATYTFDFSYTGLSGAIIGDGEFLADVQVSSPTPGETYYVIDNVTGSSNGQAITGINLTYGTPDEKLYFPANTDTNGPTGNEIPPTYFSISGISWNTADGDTWNIGNFNAAQGGSGNAVTDMFLIGSSGAFTNQPFVPVDVTVSVHQGGSLETPLPAALPLFASGLGAMGVLGWRRKRKAKTAA